MALPVDRPRTVSWVIVVATAFAIGLVVAMVPHFLFNWCEFTEFGYLGRVPAVLVALVLGALALGLVVAGLVMRLLGRRSGMATLLAGLGLGAGVGVSFLVNLPAC